MRAIFIKEDFQDAFKSQSKETIIKEYIPDLRISEELDKIVDLIIDELTNRGLDITDINNNKELIEEKIKEYFEDSAERGLRWYFKPEPEEEY